MGESAAPALTTARRFFFRDGTLPTALVRAPILRSWTRCAEFHLDSLALPRVEPMTAYELRQIRERNDALRRLCRPEIEALHADAEATDSIVILADAGGIVLDTVGNAGFAERAAQVLLRPGVPWCEAAAGTNAIGTALAEQRPAEVRGAEHYFESHGILSCSAVPIRSPTGEVVGVLDLSGPASIHHAHALGLVRLAADQIEHRFFDAGFDRCEVLRVQSDAALLGTPREGVLVFEDQRLVAANRHALALFELDWDALGRDVRRDLFPPGLSGFVDGGEAVDQGGRRLYGRLRRPKAQAVTPARKDPAPSGDGAAVLDTATVAALQRAVRLLDAGVPVLVQGETGTGKEVFARAAHARSARSRKPFIAVNCAALPEGLIEAELFGYEEGAFTGARRRGQKGLLREADGGMLFLDEIGDMPRPLQARLLRVLQEREVVPLGGGRPVTVDFTLMCATHHDLSQLVARGEFRADLHFRVAQYTLELAPLRTRENREQIVRALWVRLGGEAAGIVLSWECEQALAAFPWPGNFRQLVGTLRALIVLGEPGATLGLEALPPELRRSAHDLPSAAPHSSEPRATERLEAVTRAAMSAALAACDGNVSRAARNLGISRSTMYRRLLSAGAEEPPGTIR